MIDFKEIYKRRLAIAAFNQKFAMLLKKASKIYNCSVSSYVVGVLLGVYKNLLDLELLP